MEMIKNAKSYGFSDRRLAQLLKVQEADIRNLRKQNNLRAVYKMVDTCAAEFAAYTPYMYSTYEVPFYRVQGAESRGFKARILEYSTPRILPRM